MRRQAPITYIGVPICFRRGASFLLARNLASGVLIVLFTDFGLAGPYTGQVKAVLESEAPGVSVIDLFADAPAANPTAASPLLAAYDDMFPPGTVFLCIVDPGVGGDRAPLCLNIDGCWYVGPENGLFEHVMRQAAGAVTCWEILWRPERLSSTFHGRDLFAPIAAAVASGEIPGVEGRYAPLEPAIVRRPGWPDDLFEVVYIDHYGNAITGIRARNLPFDCGLSIAGNHVPRYETFSSVSPGQVFCYENSNGLIEIAINQGEAAAELAINIGMKVTKSFVPLEE